MALAFEVIGVSLLPTLQALPRVSALCRPGTGAGVSVALHAPRRLGAADSTSVTFAYKDYAGLSRPKTLTLGTSEFVRRFCLHLLPERFVKIRHYGLLGNRQKQTRLAQPRQLLGAARAPESKPLPELLHTVATQPAATCCPFCQRPRLVKVREVTPRPVAEHDSS